MIIKKMLLVFLFLAIVSVMGAIKGILTNTGVWKNIIRVGSKETLDIRDIAKNGASKEVSGNLSNVASLIGEQEKSGEDFRIGGITDLDDSHIVKGLAWCLRQITYLDNMKGKLYYRYQVIAFNYWLNDIHIRCKDRKYSQTEKIKADSINNKILSTFSEGLKYEYKLLWHYNEVMNLAMNKTEVIQKLLNKLKYKPGKIDGVYGPQTAKALQSFLHDYQLDQKSLKNADLLTSELAGAVLFKEIYLLLY